MALDCQAPFWSVYFFTWRGCHCQQFTYCWIGEHSAVSILLNKRASLLAFQEYPFCCVGKQLSKEWAFTRTSSWACWYKFMAGNTLQYKALLASEQSIQRKTYIYACTKRLRHRKVDSYNITQDKITAHQQPKFYPVYLPVFVSVADSPPWICIVCWSD